MWLRRDAMAGVGADEAMPRADRFTTEAVVYVDQLYATALRLTRNKSEAEDLVQDTYLKALRSARQFTPGTNLRAWLFTILRNTFRNRRRDRGRDPVEADSEQLEAVAPTVSDRTPEMALVGASLEAAVRAALDTLPPAFRDAVWLRDIDECSYEEIARLLDIPRGTVMSRISRGRRLLQARLNGARGTAGLEADEKPA
jgi:RNA polymerase sigma-70 factor, ECF subfamily